MVAFVTAYDEFAVQAFELNAVDYLLKPVERERLAATLDRARERGADRRSIAGPGRRVGGAWSGHPPTVPRAHPGAEARRMVILPVRQIASIVAEGELLHLTTLANERYAHRAPPARARGAARPAPLRPARAVTLAAVDHIQRVSAMPGGTYQVTLSNGQMLPVSRLQSRVLRETLLRLYAAQAASGVTLTVVPLGDSSVRLAISGYGAHSDWALS